MLFICTFVGVIFTIAQFIQSSGEGHLLLGMCVCFLLKCFGISENWFISQPSSHWSLLVCVCIVYMSRFLFGNVSSTFFPSFSSVGSIHKDWVPVCVCVCNLQSTSFYGNIISSLDMYALTNTHLTTWYICVRIYCYTFSNGCLECCCFWNGRPLPPFAQQQHNRKKRWAKSDGNRVFSVYRMYV